MARHTMSGTMQEPRWFIIFSGIIENKLNSLVYNSVAYTSY